MTKIGIDLGCSFHKLVLIKDNKLEKKLILPASTEVPQDKKNLEKIFETEISDDFKIYMTGGKSSQFKDAEKSGIVLVNEITAIAYGAYYFYPFDSRFLAVSIGTGTCIVSYKYNEYKHLGGSGIGGGTLAGFAGYLSENGKSSSIDELFTLAEQGKDESVDITVEDIIGSGIGIIPGNATASHLGKLNKNSSNAAFAFGVLNMVATELANLSVFCARSETFDKIVFIGYPISSPIFSKIVVDRIRMLAPKISVIIPSIPAFGTVLGAINSDKF